VSVEARPRVLSVGGETLAGMARHTTFRFCLDPTVEQEQALARHAGAARFAFNQCLRAVKPLLPRTMPIVTSKFRGRGST
jgi:hypothetical protein